jgi:hypothetical protein
MPSIYQIIWGVVASAMPAVWGILGAPLAYWGIPLCGMAVGLFGNKEMTWGKRLSRGFIDAVGACFLFFLVVSIWQIGKSAKTFFSEKMEIAYLPPGLPKDPCVLNPASCVPHHSLANVSNPAPPAAQPNPPIQPPPSFPPRPGMIPPAPRPANVGGDSDLPMTCSALGTLHPKTWWLDTRLDMPFVPPLVLNVFPDLDGISMNPKLRDMLTEQGEFLEGQNLDEGKNLFLEIHSNLHIVPLKTDDGVLSRDKVILRVDRSLSRDFLEVRYKTKIIGGQDMGENSQQLQISSLSGAAQNFIKHIDHMSESIAENACKKATKLLKP